MAQVNLGCLFEYEGKFHESSLVPPEWGTGNRLMHLQRSPKSFGVPEYVDPNTKSCLGPTNSYKKPGIGALLSTGKSPTGKRFLFFPDMLNLQL